MDFPVKTVDQLRDQLRSLRRERKLTQKGLGMQLGLGQVRVAEIESNPGSISTEQLLHILQALDAELVIRPKSAERHELAANLKSSSKMTGTLTVEPAVRPDVSHEETELAQERIRDLLKMSDDQATQVITDLVKWNGHPPGSDHDFPRTEPVTLNARDARELDYWRQTLHVDRETFLSALRAVGVVVVQDTPARNEGSW
jgi:transcriptional regulator with XRE-family HTH domain